MLLGQLFVTRCMWNSQVMLRISTHQNAVSFSLAATTCQELREQASLWGEQSDVHSNVGVSFCGLFLVGNLTPSITANPGAHGLLWNHTQLQ